MFTKRKNLSRTSYKLSLKQSDEFLRTQNNTGIHRGQKERKSNERLDFLLIQSTDFFPPKGLQRLQEDKRTLVVTKKEVNISNLKKKQKTDDLFATKFRKDKENGRIYA